MNDTAKPRPKTGWLHILVDYGPLLVFLGVYKFYQPPETSTFGEIAAVIYGTIAFMVAAVVALLFSKFKFGHISPMLILSTTLIVAFGGLTIWLQDERFIQIKPTAIYILFGILLIGGWIRGKALLQILLEAAFEGVDREGWLKLSRNWGVFFVRGGTGELVQALVRLFEELGGEVRLDCPVERIHTSNGRVTGLTSADGWSADFDAVASNADVVHTYGSLLSEDPDGRAEAARLARKRFSMSLVVVYFGTRKRHTHLAHHDILFGPRYKGLLDDIFTSGSLANDFSLYLHAPTLTDPSVAPPGCEAFYVLSPVPHLGTAAIDWSVEGPRYRDRILEYLETRYIPNLTEDLETVRIMTPADFKDVLNSHQGSAFSLEPILTQSAWFRVHNRDRRIGGLYFVGAGTHPGAGVPGVVNSAKATATLMIGDLLG